MIANKSREFLENRLLERRVITDTGCWEYRGQRNHANYGAMEFYPNGKRKRYFAHRIAFELWKGKIPDGYYVCHRCDNPPCFNPDHLFAGTHAENIKDAARKGRMKHKPNQDKFGEDNKSSKLKEHEVLEIRELCKSSGLSQAEIARRYGVSHQLITHIVRKTIWKHI